MCILFIYRNSDADANSYRLIVASNRDEMYKRPTLSAHYWDQYPDCLGGIDMEPGKEGGTWLALSTKGKAAVTLNFINNRCAIDASKKGRGPLITNFITSNDSMELYLDKLHRENVNGQPYNPYCLILLNLYNANVHYLNSCIGSTGPIMCNSDIIGIGNSGLDRPYKKVEAGKEEFKRIVKNADITNQNNLIEELVNFLKSKKRYLPDPELQERSPTRYKELSSIFVSIGKEYGTRTHSILLVDGMNRVIFVEETLMPDFTWKRQQFKTNLM
ncbi:PREDICTED: transport and Golgi organization protein 2 homolog [Dinoponera quadriceps]|uniref:Transport and Golgi organization protein 2 homolog n=1 Tax=Dinoponera quadriceps TaxID=609295 RepID=A0A6P3XNS3_DINQU|nr:PREDICTED: transport and Golgi organization protein 2 homolog [Dinoponera quadriceps]XP_014479593.1 PREDICTED: transport and Golgi organization protein 2 homolog [Dinoponera quadriceps]XP_014479594.1 PREDICTED: transport and Golgi organization protein 2 homolog [Dinoponera quadriceps]XP_014479595.1 PREDICTED: transport and Golgi organization protein 2 homolog [Dinoponera quadriceps]